MPMPNMATEMYEETHTVDNKRRENRRVSAISRLQGAARRESPCPADAARADAAEAQRRSLGSSASLSPSPRKLNPITVKKIARPGNTPIQPGLPKEIPPFGEHSFPAGVWRLRAQTEETQRGLGQDGKGQTQA